MKRKIKSLIQIAVVLMAILLVAGYSIDSFVVDFTKGNIKTVDYLESVDKEYDCIIVLGCGVKSDGTPSDMLYDRLKTGIDLYNKGLAPKIVMSGDHGSHQYDEVNVMKEYAKKSGVPSENIFMDHAGFSTYESIYRLKEIFGVENAIIVTQSFHLPRALYIAGSFDISASGVSADLRNYRGIKYVELREMLARNKDFISCLIKPKPTFLGDAIPISGNGDVTND